MAIVSLEPGELKRLIRRRRRAGGDRWDEVWEGVYVMPPLADNEHQRLGLELAIDVRNVLGPDEGIQIFAGCNISDQPKRWRRNYRCPDLAVFLPGNPAEDRGSHWFGGPDFAVEIISRSDRSREKFGFYARVGVRELLLVDRRPWRLELYRRGEDGWVLVGESPLDSTASPLRSEVLPVTFRLASGRTRPKIEVARVSPPIKEIEPIPPGPQVHAE
jgi:Uma2 family endonuclease